MHDLSRLSVIFSVKIDSGERLRNLILNLSYYERFFCNYELIIVEQDIVSKLDTVLKNREGVRHYFFPSHSCHLKTRNLNWASAVTTRPYIMMCDCDVINHPESLLQTLFLLDEGAAFVSPHNGILVEIKQRFLQMYPTIEEIVARLQFFPKDFDRRLETYDYDHFQPLYGSSYYDSTGGCIAYAREPFFLVGGWNPNFISYGFEDMEFVYRLQKLGYRHRKIEKFNLYHFEHSRSFDSVYNNYYEVNKQEWNHVCAMSAGDLLVYARNNFQHLLFDTSSVLRVHNSKQKFELELIKPQKIDLADLSIIIPLFLVEKSWLIYLEQLLYYFDEYYAGYEVILVEGTCRNGKYLSNRKNMQYYWLGPGEYTVEQAVAKGISKCSKSIIAIWDMFTMIEPNKLRKSLQSIKRSGRHRKLNDLGWYLKEQQKGYKGSGVLLYSRAKIE